MTNQAAAAVGSHKGDKEENRTTIIRQVIGLWAASSVLWNDILDIDLIGFGVQSVDQCLVHERPAQ